MAQPEPPRSQEPDPFARVGGLRVPLLPVTANEPIGGIPNAEKPSVPEPGVPGDHRLPNVD
jgi:hypothetical protein